MNTEEVICGLCDKRIKRRNRLRHLRVCYAHGSKTARWPKETLDKVFRPVTAPMQPLVFDARGVIRFKENKIVRALLDTGKLNLNVIEAMDFPLEDRIQFIQLIGTSVSGAGDVPYMPKELIAQADAQAERLIQSQKKRT